MRVQYVRMKVDGTPSYYVFDADVPDRQGYLGLVEQLVRPRTVAGQVMRWRAYFAGKWLDMARRQDFAANYERYSGGAK